MCSNNLSLQTIRDKHKNNAYFYVYYCFANVMFTTTCRDICPPLIENILINVSCRYTLTRLANIDRLKLKGDVKFSKSYTTESLSDSTTHYARPNELFGSLQLDVSLSEDSIQGRILLQNVNYILITCLSQPVPHIVFECRILDHSRDCLVFNATANFIEFSGITAETHKTCQVNILYTVTLWLVDLW